jgi:flagellar FliL protein
MSPDDKMNADATAIAEADGDEKASKGKKGLPSFIIYIVIALVMAGGGYFAGGLLTGSSEGEPQKAEHKKDTKEGKKDDKHAEAGPSEVYLMEDIIVNPSGTGGTRFLSASIGIEVTSQATVKLIEKREPVIKDALITILGSKTIEQLSDTKEKEITRYQIKKRLEILLKADDILAVYFTDFILQ